MFTSLPHLDILTAVQWLPRNHRQNWHLGLSSLRVPA
jgi:hypothetical protein